MLKILSLVFLMFLGMSSNTHAQENIVNECPLPDPEIVGGGGGIVSGLFIDTTHHLAVHPITDQILLANQFGIYRFDSVGLDQRYIIRCSFSDESHFGRGLLEWLPLSYTQFASFSIDNGIEIWDAKQGDILYSMRGENDPLARDPVTGEEFSISTVDVIEWSPSSRYIASIGQYGSIPLRVWDIETREIVFEYPVVHDVISGGVSHQVLTWSPDGSLLAFADHEANVIRIWNTETWEEEQILEVTLPYNSSFAHSIDWSPNGQYLAVGGEKVYLQIWNTENWRQESVLDDIFASTIVNWSPDSTILAVAGVKYPESLAYSYATLIYLIDSNSWEIISTFEGHTLNIADIDWTSDSQHIISLARQDFASQVISWDVETGEIIAELVPPSTD